MNGRDHPLRVLLVDDHPLVRTGIRAVLQDQFGRVQIGEAGTAGEALNHLETAQPRIVLVDLSLPGTSGLDLVRQLRARDARLLVLVVAASADPWSVDEALKAGAAGFVAKTNASELLPAAIEAVLGGRIFLCADARVALQRARNLGAAVRESPGPSILSQREQEVLRHLAGGQNTKTIASLLEISPKTVETHRAHLMHKLRIDSIAQLTRYALRYRLVQT